MLDMAIIYNKYYIFKICDYIRYYYSRDIYPLLRTFTSFVVVGGQYYVLLLARFTTDRRDVLPE